MIYESVKLFKKYQYQHNLLLIKIIKNLANKLDNLIMLMELQVYNQLMRQ